MGRRMLQPVCVFDFDQFRADVIAYRTRQGWSTRRLATAIGMSDGTLFGFLNSGRRTVGHDALASLAYIADLDLNRYVSLPADLTAVR